MKIFDMMTVFLVIFMCYVIPRSLTGMDMNMNFVLEKENNRIMDGVAMDAMLDTVVTENDGDAYISSDKVTDNYEKAIGSVYDISENIYSDAAIEIEKSDVYHAYRALDPKVYDEQTYDVTDDINGARGVEKSLLSFIKMDKFKQGVYGPSFFCVFSPTGERDTVFSGSRTEKRRTETDRSLKLDSMNRKEIYEK